MTISASSAADLGQTAFSPQEILRRNGRSFHFASKFLGRRHAQRAAAVYAFCRHVDDVADGAHQRHVARNALQRIDLELAQGRSDHPIVASFLDCANRMNLDLQIAHLLVQGVRTDLDEVRIASPDELVRYAYHVAGVVGLMMCSALDVQEREAHPFAIDLGIAMQLTNIARDVLEDAENGRRYLPGAWVQNIEPGQIIHANQEDHVAIAIAIERVLHLAERYYASALGGMAYLPPRARLAILIAARVYRAIGVKMMQRNCLQWRERTIVSGPSKAGWAAKAMGSFVTNGSIHTPPSQHDSTLHGALRGLPGANHD